VDIKSTSELQREAEAALTDLMTAEPRPEARAELDEATALEQLVALPGVGDKLAARLVSAGFRGLAALAEATPEALQEIEGIGPRSAEKILQAAREAMAQGSPGAPAPAESAEALTQPGESASAEPFAAGPVEAEPVAPQAAAG
jgi:ERCC4-type nuclease